MIAEVEAPGGMFLLLFLHFFLLWTPFFYFLSVCLLPMLFLRWDLCFSVYTESCAYVYLRLILGGGGGGWRGWVMGGEYGL